MWVQIIISVGICISYLATPSEGGLFIYQRNYDIYDHRNWLDHYPQKDCQGLILDDFSGVTSARELEVKQIVFKKMGTFMINEDTEIIFNAESKSIMNCIAINGTEMDVHLWTDPDNWLIHGKESNMAVPHMERLPCQHDDVAFPKGILTGQIFLFQKVIIKSLLFGNEYWNNDDFLEHKKHVYLRDTITVLSKSSLDLQIKNESCMDLSGCPCGNEYVNNEICTYVSEPDSFDCLNPILPIWFCYKICGASIVFKPNYSFKIANIENKLKEYNSDTHVSKVRNDDEEYVIQIIFTEKQFSGDSIEEAKSFYQVLKDDKTLRVHNPELLTSSYHYNEGERVKSAVSIVFGSLLSACVVFGLLFLVFGDEERSKRFRERLGLGSKPLTYRSMFFSRNSSVSEGAGLIIERQSVAGSLQNIPKSFENPMFSEMKKKYSSTSSSSASSREDVTKDERNETKADDKTEQMIFEEQETRELIETVAEEGELVDLTDMNK